MLVSKKELKMNFIITTASASLLSLNWLLNSKQKISKSGDPCGVQIYSHILIHAFK